MNSRTATRAWVWASSLALALILASCGGGGGSASSAPSPAATGTLELLAGASGGAGNIDGPRTQARFTGPSGLAMDSSGTLYVGELRSHDVRKIAGDEVTTWVQGIGPGSGPAASGSPGAMAIGLAGNLYYTDSELSIIGKIDAAGNVSTFAGANYAIGSADGIGPGARFSQPTGIAIDAQQDIFVADSGNCTIRKITPDGVVTTFAGAVGQAGEVDGPAANARFDSPRALAIDANGNIVVADRTTIRQITPSGNVTTLAGTAGVTGIDDGTGPDAQFLGPQGIAVDAAGNVYITDYNYFSGRVRRMTPDRRVVTIAGFTAPGAAGALQLSPTGVVVGSDGTAYVATDYRILAISQNGNVSTYAGAATMLGMVDGAGAAARFNVLGHIAQDGAVLYVTDAGNSAIRRVSTAGDVTTFATGFRMRPGAVAVDPAHNVYASDTSLCMGLCTESIYKFAPDGTKSTFASSQTTKIYDVNGAAWGPDGALYLAQAPSQSSGSIEKLGPDGVATTMVGYSAGFYQPHGITVDPAGDVYVADTFNHMIWKVSAAGEVVAIAGQKSMPGSNDGQGAAARFCNPTGIARDDQGDLYVADSGNATVRKITPDGVVSTVVGVAGRRGLVTGSLPGVLPDVSDVTVAGSDMYIATSTAVLVVHNRP